MVTRILSLLLAAISLTACVPVAELPTPTVEAAAPSPPATIETAPAAPTPKPEASPPMPTETATAPTPTQPNASISGAIRDGNRPPPALRICAAPVAGGVPTCIDSPQGATRYRIDVEAGRYYLMGWVQGGELTLIAHASQIRCIRAPCPPDELIEVEVTAGEHLTDIDLNGGYAEVPAGWPQRP